MNIVAQVASCILIRIGRLHSIDRSHETGMLVDRVFVDHDVFHDRRQFHVAARLQPLADSAVVQIACCQLFVLDEQRNQLVYVIGYQVAVGVDDEVLVFEER